MTPKHSLNADASTRDRLGGDDRGVSEVLGALLLFALVVALVVMIQVTAVPAANQQVEFEHSMRVQQDMQSLDEAVYRTAGTGVGGSAAVELGLTYPPRFFLLNPPPVIGEIRSGESASIELSNVEATDPEADQWWGTATTHTYSNRPLSYEAEYNELDSLPTVHAEGNVLFNENPEGRDTVLDRTVVIDDDRITLVSLAGNVSEAGVRPETIQTTPLSAPMTRMTVTNREPNQPIVIRLRTSLEEERWHEMLDGEPNVLPIQYTTGSPYNTVVISLKPGVTYDLRMAKVGVGDGTNETPGPKYMVARSTTSETLRPGEQKTMTVEVRDRYNNVKSGVNVTFEVTGGSGTFTNGQNSITVTTDSRGEASATLTPTTQNGTVTVRAYADLSSPAGVQNYEEVLFETSISSSTDQQTPDYIDQGGDSGIHLAKQNPIVLHQQGKWIDIEFVNEGGSIRTLESIRMPIYYAPSRASGASRSRPEMFSMFLMDGVEKSVGVKYVTIASEKADLSQPSQVVWSTTQPDKSRTLRFHFYEGSSTNPNEVEIINNDFFIIRLIFKDGTASTYYIQVPS